MQYPNKLNWYKKTLIGLISSSTLLVGCNNNSKTPEQIKEQLLKEIPGVTKIDAVNKSPVDGMYEVVVGRKVFYATTDGKYLFFGNLIDPKNKKSLTEERTMELSRIDWKKLPLDLAIVEVNGSGKRKIAIFSDPDCPYCQMFEKQILPTLTDTTVYSFIFPLPRHPDAKLHAKQIWCSSNRVQSWTSWMRSGKMLSNNSNCDTSALDKIYETGTNLVQLEAAPTLILENGQILPGMLPADQLIAEMDKASGNNGVQKTN